MSSTPAEIRTRPSVIPSALPVFRRDRGVRHRGGVGDQRFDAAEALGERHQPHAVQQPARGLERAELEREHPAEAAHLTPRQLVLRMRGKARIVDALDLGMRGQKLREREAIGVVLRHAERKGLGAPQDQPRVHRAENRARGVLHELQPLDVVVAVGDDDPADAVAVAVEVFRRAVRDEIGAKLERPLDVGARERVVDDQPGLMPMSEIGGGAEVGDPHDRVARRLDEEQSGRGSEGSLDRVEIGGIHVAERQLIARQDLVEEPERPAVDVVGDDHVIARLEHRRDGIDRRHARRERKRRLAGLHRGDVAFERGARRVLRPGVFVALVPAERVLDVGGRLINRRDDRSGRRVGLLAGVETDGAEPRVGSQFHETTNDSM